MARGILRRFRTKVKFRCKARVASTSYSWPGATRLERCLHLGANLNPARNHDALPRDRRFATFLQEGGPSALQVSDRLVNMDRPIADLAVTRITLWVGETQRRAEYEPLSVRLFRSPGPPGGNLDRPQSQRRATLSTLAEVYDPQTKLSGLTLFSLGHGSCAIK